MKEALKDLLDSKQKLFEMQKLFSKTKKKRYPSLVTQSVDGLVRDINTELDFLLSSAVRNKSGRIVIKAPKWGWKKELVLTRSPSLKSPHESYSALTLTDIQRIIKNGDLVCGRGYYDEKEDGRKRPPVIFTSILKTSKMILQDKLEDFYGFLQNVIDWKQEINELINRGYEDEKHVMMVGKSKVKIYSCHFEFIVFNPEAKEKHEDFESLDSHRIVDYGGFRGSGWGNDEGEEDDAEDNRRSIENQGLLLRVLADFEEFDKVLIKAEKTKKKLMRIGNDILEKMKGYNKPARVLKKIIQSSV